MLVEAAIAVGAEADMTAKFLESNEGEAEIKLANSRMNGLGINGIPTLILGGKWVLPSGAVGANTLVEAFRTIEAQGGADGTVFAGDLRIPPSVLEETIDVDLARC
jgi:predicted DsbA family dithiol-disulfide isomerase